jgi:AcrR family transcriptional regulator
MSALDVARHQRARLLRAALELAADRGYERITVRDVVSAAKVSSRTFYEHFTGKRDCVERARILAQDLAQRSAAAIATLTTSAEDVAGDVHLDDLDRGRVPWSSLAELPPSPSRGTQREQAGDRAPTGDRPAFPRASTSRPRSARLAKVA